MERKKKNEGLLIFVLSIIAVMFTAISLFALPVGLSLGYFFIGNLRRGILIGYMIGIIVSIVSFGCYALADYFHGSKCIHGQGSRKV